VLFSATSAGSIIPGIPNTGADVTNTLVLLALMGLVAAVGVFLARRLMVK
jgi:LPXTG-motif cell wall-anchored protein